MNQAGLDQRKFFCLHVSTIIRYSSFGQSLLLSRKEVESLVRVLGEIDDPQVRDESNHWSYQHSAVNNIFPIFLTNS
jgi:hypothetical protein